MAHEQFPLLGWKDFIHPNDFEDTCKAFFTSIESGQSYHVTHRLRRADRLQIHQVIINLVTTKAKGMGIGLAISRSINNPGGGANSVSY